MTSYNRPADDERVEARLTAYALDELEGQERAEVEAGLATSETARETVRSIRGLAKYLREAAQARAVSPSVALRAAVETRLRQVDVQPAGTRSAESDSVRVPLLRRLDWRAWAAIAAAACLVIGGVSLYFVEHRTRAVADSQSRIGERPNNPVTPQPPSSADFDTESGSCRVYIWDRVASNLSAISFTYPTPSGHSSLGFPGSAAVSGADVAQNAGEDAGAPSNSTHAVYFI